MCCAASNDLNGAVYGIRPTCVSQHKKGTKSSEMCKSFKVGARRDLEVVSVLVLNCQMSGEGRADKDKEGAEQ